ncbi:YbaB/EbfC family nucleoid-associated protein [Pseudopedobacter sp.]|uniref:YbaB/EbfC family nucleoid-associated protein n=1 Tax=Pseudopedobacter sp. TaxID=1936787 RepID=UPI0033411FF2
MFDKLFEAQQKAEEIKKRLDSISVRGEAEGGAIQVIVTANKKVKEVKIDEEFFKNADKEEIEELLVVALNKAFEQADNISQSETAAMTQEMLGSMGGLGALGKLFGK